MTNPASSETKHTTLPIEELRALLAYDPKTGLFTRISTGRPALCTLRADGYLWGRVKGKLLLAHRAAWATTHGYWPGIIDHINRVRTLNRIDNLREVEAEMNCANTITTGQGRAGFRGVGFLPSANKFVARCASQYLGCYSAPEEAARAFDAEARARGFDERYLNFPNDPRTQL